MFLPGSSLLQAAPVVRDPGALLDDDVDDRVVLSVLAGVSRFLRAPLDSPGSSGLLWAMFCFLGRLLPQGGSSVLHSTILHSTLKHLKTSLIRIILPNGTNKQSL